MTQLIFILSIGMIGLVTDAIGVRRVYILAAGLFFAASVYGYYHLYVRGKGSSLENEASAVI